MFVWVTAFFVLVMFLMIAWAVGCAVLLIGWLLLKSLTILKG